MAARMPVSVKSKGPATLKARNPRSPGTCAGTSSSGLSSDSSSAVRQTQLSGPASENHAGSGAAASRRTTQ